MCGYFIKNYFLYLIAVITSVLAAFLAGNIPAIKPITKQKTRIPKINEKLGTDIFSIGCPIIFSVIDFATAMMNNMATFEEGNIDNSYLEDVKDEECYIVL